MLEPFPDFTPAEMEQVRRMNQRLHWAPRFRAPTPLGRMMIQTMLGAGAYAPLGVRGVRIATRRIHWMGHSVSLRILRPASGETRGVYIDYHGGGWAIGTASMDDQVNARIARDCNLTVVSVDYTTLPDITFANQSMLCGDPQCDADWDPQANLLAFVSGDELMSSMLLLASAVIVKAS